MGSGSIAEPHASKARSSATYVRAHAEEGMARAASTPQKGVELPPSSSLTQVLLMPLVITKCKIQ